MILQPCRLTLEYDGSAYSGWQVQKNAVSVQEKLEAALERLTGTFTRVRGAGRTDAGVHARGQTVLAHVPVTFPVEKLAAALNSRLPDDIAVTAAAPAPADFDPRRQCVMKQYSYSVTTGGLRPALGNRRSWYVKWPLDAERMAEAAARLVGERDFTSFANHEVSGKDNVRTVNRSELMPLPPDAAGRRRLVFFFEGRSFLYNMVRAMVGTLIGVGAGRFRPDDIDAMLAAKNRAAAGQSAPPWGLCLEWTMYPGDTRPADGAGLFSW